MSSHLRKPCAKRRLDELIRESAPRKSMPRRQYWRLVTAVRASSDLLQTVPDRGSVPRSSVEDVVRACVHMAKRGERWQQQPENWTAPNGSPFVQFRSLVSHLFDRFPVPTFMAPVWCSAKRQSWGIDLYLHLAAGRSIRQFQWPLPYPVRMTKREARWFMQAPDDGYALGAFRWAQVRALGGKRRLADLLMLAPALVIPTEHEEFWKSVIRFLIDNQPLTNDEVEAIVQFVDQQKFQPAEKVWGHGAGQQPLQPDFSLKGRSLMSLRRHMANWRNELLTRNPSLTESSSKWPQANIGAFRQTVGDTLWTIDELLSDRELRIEGGIMKHCVATYIQECARRETTIWSMKMQQGERRKRTLTIEVFPNSKIVWDAKGKQNASPDETATGILRQWAAQEGLQLREYDY